MKRGDGMVGSLVRLGALALVAAVWFAARGVRRSAQRRREAEGQARLRWEARARHEAGMPPGHPEAPVPPDVAEEIRHGGFYAHVRAELGDREVQP